MKKLIKKYSVFCKYMTIGIVGTIFNITIYMLLVYFFEEQYLVCNIIAYIFSLIIIFTLNKIYVFDDKNNTQKYILKQFVYFGLSRIISLGIDTYVLYLCIDKFHLGSLLSKIIANAGTTILNYFVGEWLIFNNKTFKK